MSSLYGTQTLAIFAAIITVSVVTLRKQRLASNVALNPQFPHVIKEKYAENQDCRWIALKKIIYADDSGKIREWEKAERRTRNPKSDVDGVLIVAKIQGGIRDGCVPFVSQFRPAVGRKTLELPAGLVDKGESIEDAAVRELREETGYIGTVREVSPPLYLDPGMSSSALRLVRMYVDGTRPENQNPLQSLDVGEFCEVMYLKYPTRGKIEELGKNLAIDANVYLCCLE